MLGSIIGAAIGFFLGFVIGILLLFLVGRKFFIRVQDKKVILDTGSPSWAPKEGRNVSAHADGEPIWSPNGPFHRLFILTANTFRRSLTFLSCTLFILIPLLALGGAALGGYIGKMQMRRRNDGQ